jgi:hypothetical protein
LCRRGLAPLCLYHPAAMARARCLRRVPLRGAGTCLDAADDRRNSRRARNCSGEAGVVASVLFLVTMAGSLLVVQAGGLFLRDAESLSVDPRRGCGQTGDQAQATVNVGNDTDNRRGCHLISLGQSDVGVRALIFVRGAANPRRIRTCIFGLPGCPATAFTSSTNRSSAVRSHPRSSARY